MIVSYTDCRKQSDSEQGRRQVFRARGSRSSGYGFTCTAATLYSHPLHSSKKLGFAQISRVILLEARRGYGPLVSPPAAAPDSGPICKQLGRRHNTCLQKLHKDVLLEKTTGLPTTHATSYTDISQCNQKCINKTLQLRAIMCIN